MRLLRASYSVAFFGLLLVGCKSGKISKTPPTFEEIITTPAKTNALSDEETKIWHHLDIEKDSIAGMSLAKAYQFLEGKQGRPVIVAIADSGLDIEHEDLKDVIWVNKNEIVGNKIDDDNNGYIDDINGWNFLGNAKGDIVVADQLEITRLYKKGKQKFEGKKVEDIAEADKKSYEEFLKLEKEYKATVAEKESELSQMKMALTNLKKIEEVIAEVKKFAKKDTLTTEVLKNIKTESLDMTMKVQNLQRMYSQGATEEGLKEYKTQVIDYKEYLDKAIKGYDLDLTDRENLGDKLYDIADKYYGNNNVIGSKDDEMHGTHVGGIVASNRTNNIGAVGVANNVKIMSVRIVPDGDEHDKDVALGIRYAVDNGAKIINTSFGKRYSPNAEWVYNAIKYAASKDVLIVNAAGNDSKDIDVRKSYPSDSKDLVTEFTDNVLTIGASSLNYNKELPASFSNYGKINVDIFAPGVNIYSTIPKDKYKPESGTSMAAPATSGVAALIRSYYPNLSAKEVKEIIMNSGVKINFDVIKPGSKTQDNPDGKLVPFADLSVTGRIVNAYNALQLADYVSRKKK